ncbi:hypothetical protein CPB84DRAFT_1849844 [Gymnopilus junonius]|uniref:Uncharacterized protein n=1 Tax=Gymnopilus junonius TaxID=109634 RepID=A0A9P5NH19_GYMJU|nr:hypothetical protein CPB84DRAFT_1849844 [Gymnopilus junonius]
MPRQDLVHHGILADPYADCAFFQCSSSELVIYSPTAGQRPLRKAYRALWYQELAPLSRPPLAMLLQFDRGRCLRVLPYVSLGLQFLIKFDVTPKYCHSLLKLSKPPDHCGTLPSMGTIVSNFLRNAAAVQGPYFRGFCREHLIDYPGVVQLAGAPLAMCQLSTAQVSRHGALLYASLCWLTHHAKALLRSELICLGVSLFSLLTGWCSYSGKAQTRIVCKKVHPSEVLIGVAAGEATSGSSNAIAGPSLLPSEQAGSDRFTREGAALARLLETGVYTSDMPGLVECCDKCGIYYTATKLCSHIITCADK